MKKASITQSVYGTLPNGQQVDTFKLKNGKGMEVDIITFGGIITNLKVPNGEGVSENIVLGYDKLDSYLENPTFFGAIIGRYGNRIAHGKFTLNDTVYSLETNNGPHHLHGGSQGFDKAVWDAKTIETEETVALELAYLSPDMEAGFPGNLKVTVLYTLTSENALEIQYKGITDKPTLVNLTQHSYFNLSGDFYKSIENQELMIDADFFVPIDETAIPFGHLESVKNTPFDFTVPKRIGQDINADNQQIKNGFGYDHTFVINQTEKGLTRFATVLDQDSKRYMEVYTTEPGVQLYTGNFIDAALPLANGEIFANRTGLCLETQHYPDSPNQNQFPSTVLQPGEFYHSATTYKFSVV
ncbi:aldose 1-epimerase [Formosa agariphila KMM 3901]|uniref:Aldose 1-epimerase n=1 Tax=Formosa agariphila (strain DSM 15362 / KCTC 12365 / LMG 23005 / KMM 3901 / M-2Alg 35-1) TaxID=1347342 RepID=T2KML4_FORAG